MFQLLLFQSALGCLAKVTQEGRSQPSSPDVRLGAFPWDCAVTHLEQPQPPAALLISCLSHGFWTDWDVIVSSAHQIIRVFQAPGTGLPPPSWKTTHLLIIVILKPACAVCV